MRIADQDGDGEPPPRNKMFSTFVSIGGLLKFLTSHLVGGVTIACELAYLIGTRYYRYESPQ